ncbi:exodeoxyribonuclease III [Fusibacter bizertensis]|uniref:Exodeoxyribonuclease III n=1 Tax=Fusibacter bizertensis TaxID=1488331 RepID=A0ABT6NG40_9FIRM|nr:exodeoxyribonuclease III [Fusibacter bizertensis]MDH8679398.1 exodeoxyribonuclease III [Fusibacter bizertensis]
MRFISWNIDSLNAALTSDSNRALLTRKVIETIIENNPDVIAMQETKLPSNGPNKKHMEELANLFEGYVYKWRSSQEPARKGYAGTMFLYKEKYSPVVYYPEIEAPDTMDLEGRIMTLDFGDFYLTQVYTPNAGDNLRRLKERQVWDEKYANYLQKLDQKKPVLATGDFNVAHMEIDLANPQNNHMSAGFTDEERKGFTNLLNKGFTDTFRYVNGEIEGAYTWWAQRVKTSKINNSGWRIDYWLVSDRVADQVVRSEMIDSGERQDHTPIMLDIEL